jgi:hypothetical protein
MGRIVGTFAAPILSEVREFVADLAGDKPLQASPGGIARLPGGKGWRVGDEGGQVVVTEFEPEEIERIAASEFAEAAAKAAQEEALRELSRRTREMGPRNPRAPL